MKLLDVNSPEEIPEKAASPDQAKEEKKSPAEIGVLYYNQLLFKVERTLKDLPADDRKGRRLLDGRLGDENLIYAGLFIAYNQSKSAFTIS